MCDLVIRKERKSKGLQYVQYLTLIISPPSSYKGESHRILNFSSSIHSITSDHCTGQLATSSFTCRVVRASRKRSQGVLFHERLKPGCHRSQQRHFDATW